MGKLAKLKKSIKRSSNDAGRAEAAAERAERAAERAELELRRVRGLLANRQAPAPELAQSPPDRPPIYTAPAASGATPPAAEVKSQP